MEVWVYRRRSQWWWLWIHHPESWCKGGVNANGWWDVFMWRRRMNSFSNFAFSFSDERESLG